MEANKWKKQPQPRTPKAFGGTFSGVKYRQIYTDEASADRLLSLP